MQRYVLLLLLPLEVMRLPLLQQLHLQLLPRVMMKLTMVLTVAVAFGVMNVLLQDLLLVLLLLPVAATQLRPEPTNTERSSQRLLQQQQVG